MKNLISRERKTTTYNWLWNEQQQQCLFTVVFWHKQTTRHHRL